MKLGARLKQLMDLFKKQSIYLLHKISSKRLFLNYFQKVRKSNAGMIVTLHRITSNTAKAGLNEFIEMDINTLEKMIIELKRLDVRFVKLAEVDIFLKNKNLKNPIVHLSFDDGYLDNYTLAFELFKKHAICFSIFLVTDFINDSRPFLWNYLIENIVKNKIPVSFEKYDFEISEHEYLKKTGEEIFDKFRNLILENLDADTDYFKNKIYSYINEDDSFLPKMLNWEQINEMVSSGLCEIGAHTKTHARFKKLTNLERQNEILESKNEIKKRTGIDVKYFAYPYGGKEDIGRIDSLPDIMKQCEIDAAFTSVPMELNESCNKYLIPRLFLNNNLTPYTLKARLDGTYQRQLSLHKINKQWVV
jgi:peptidoglycan/xylan/chitin deacetylase (PgdA/CDA1 family)